MKFGAAAVLNDVVGSKLLVAEGPETALSIHQAMPEYPVMATLSVTNFKNAEPLEKGKSIIYCPDNDIRDDQLDKLGGDSSLRPPIGESDFNDTLIAHRVDWVRRRIESELAVGEKLQSVVSMDI